MITRRQFLTYSLGAAAGTSLSAMLPEYAKAQNQVSSALKYKTKVCIIKNQWVWKNGSINLKEVGHMLDTGIRVLSGSDDFAKAWQTYIAANDTLALKVNPVAPLKSVSDQANILTL
jgi:hypothetical protein